MFQASFFELSIINFWDDEDEHLVFRHWKKNIIKGQPDN